MSQPHSSGTYPSQQILGGMMLTAGDLLFLGKALRLEAEKEPCVPDSSHLEWSLHFGLGSNATNSPLSYRISIDFLEWVSPHTHWLFALRAVSRGFKWLG